MKRYCQTVLDYLANMHPAFVSEHSHVPEASLAHVYDTDATESEESEDEQEVDLMHLEELNIN